MSLVASGKPRGKDVLRRAQTALSGAAKQLSEMRDAEALDFTKEAVGDLVSRAAALVCGGGRARLL